MDLFWDFAAGIGAGCIVVLAVEFLVCLLYWLATDEDDGN